MIKKYRKKPITIEAIQFADNADCITSNSKHLPKGNERARTLTNVHERTRTSPKKRKERKSKEKKNLFLSYSLLTVERREK